MQFETNQMMNAIKCIDPDAVIDISRDGYFYLDTHLTQAESSLKIECVQLPSALCSVWDEIEQGKVIHNTKTNRSFKWLGYMWEEVKESG